MGAVDEAHIVSAASGMRNSKFNHANNITYSKN